MEDSRVASRKLVARLFVCLAPSKEVGCISSKADRAKRGGEDEKREFLAAPLFREEEAKMFDYRKIPVCLFFATALLLAAGASARGDSVMPLNKVPRPG